MGLNFVEIPFTEFLVLEIYRYCIPCKKREGENMALFFTRLSWLWLGGKPKDKVSNGSSVNSVNSLGECNYDYDDDDDEKRAPPSNPNRIKAKKRKCKSRNERVIIDKDHEDSVLVPSDGVCLSGSESDGSDWSVGWLEPHAPNFQSDDSFAVLVPCYRRGCLGFDERGGNSTKNPSGGHSEGGREYMERWLSSLQKF